MLPATALFEDPLFASVFFHHGLPFLLFFLQEFSKKLLPYSSHWLADELPIHRQDLERRFLEQHNLERHNLERHNLECDSS